MFSKKAALSDFITDNLTFIIILVIVLVLLMLLYFSGTIGSSGIEETTSGFGKDLINMIGAGRR